MCVYSKQRHFFVNIFINQLKQVQHSNTRFSLRSDEMMTGFVKAAVVGAEWRGASLELFAPCCAKLQMRVIDKLLSYEQH